MQFSSSAVQQFSSSAVQQFSSSPHPRTRAPAHSRDRHYSGSSPSKGSPHPAARPPMGGRPFAISHSLMPTNTLNGLGATPAPLSPATARPPEQASRLDVPRGRTAFEP